MERESFQFGAERKEREDEPSRNTLWSRRTKRTRPWCCMGRRQHPVQRDAWAPFALFPPDASNGSPTDSTRIYRTAPAGQATPRQPREPYPYPIVSKQDAPNTAETIPPNTMQPATTQTEIMGAVSAPVASTAPGPPSHDAVAEAAVPDPRARVDAAAGAIECLSSALAAHSSEPGAAARRVAASFAKMDSQRQAQPTTRRTACSHSTPGTAVIVASPLRSRARSAPPTSPMPCLASDSV